MFKEFPFRATIGKGGVTQRGDWKTCILYMLKAVEVTSNITYNKINDIISSKDAIQQAVVDDMEINRAESLVNVIFTQPITRFKYFMEQGLYAENTAKKYLNQLVDMGILE